MTGDVCLSPVTDRAADAIASVHRLSRAWYYGTRPDSEDGREAMWAELIAQPGRITYLAESAAYGAVGFMSAIRVTQPRLALELTALYVLPEHMGSGIGSQLYDQFDAERREDEEGALEVWRGNAVATTFYSRRGWVPTGTTRPGPQRIAFATYRLPTKRQSR